MKLVVYNEWQKKGYPLGPSFAAADASLHRRLRRRHTPRVKASARSSFSSSAQFAHPHLGAEECSWGEGREKTFLTAFNFDNKVFGSPSGCPQEAEELFVATQKNAQWRYEGYKALAEMK